jgi:hypothetical protein
MESIENLHNLPELLETMNSIDQLKSKRFWLTILFVIALGVITNAGWMTGDWFGWMSTITVGTYLVSETIRPSGFF